jgi:hypothetical protein
MKLNYDDFSEWWAQYPKREAKINAMKAYGKARKLASAEDILAGLERWKRTMPQDRQFQPLPASWLNAGRWMDEPPQTFLQVQTAKVEDDWMAECYQLHHGLCGNGLAHRTRMIEAYRKRESA